MATEAAAVSLKDTFGSAYVGAMIMMILYGITCLQTYFFFIHYPRDSLSTKLLVLFIWMLDTLHAALVSHTMYYHLVTNFNNIPALNNITWSLCLSLGVNVLIAFVVQIFFTEKIHGLSGNNWWITGPIAFAVVAHFAFGIVPSVETMVGFFMKKTFNRLHELNYIAALPFAITAILSDIAITTALCALLQIRKTNFQSTNALLNILIIYAINRCLLTSILAVIEVIVFVARPETLWFLAVDFVIGKCYANSLLATLNTRQALRGKGLDDTETLGPQLSTLEGLTPTAIEIAGVTPSMVTRSRSNAQTGMMSVSFGDRSSGTRSTEMREFEVNKPPTEETPARVSFSPSEPERRYSHNLERWDKRES